MAKEKKEEVQETEPEEDNDIMSLVGLDNLPTKSGGDVMSGSLQIQLYRQDGRNTKKNIDHLKGTVELMPKAFPNLFGQVAGAVRSKWEQYAMVYKALALIEIATQEIDGESMLEYGLRKVRESKEKK